MKETVDSWKNSSKNLWKLVDSGMTSNSKVGLGYEIQSNKEVLSYEEEMNRTVFKLKDLVGNTFEHSSESESESISVHMSDLHLNLSHLIKDCDYYEKKMAREAEFKKQRVFNTGNRVAKPVWTNANRVNHANHFVPRPLQLNAGRPNVNSVRPNVNTGRVNVNSVKHNVNSVRTHVNTGRTKQPDHPLKNMEDRGIFDSGCSGHMTGNKDHLDDFEECKGGSVTFGGSKGYITGKGRIRVGNLDFDSVSFVKELGHFNLFSISQICDKQHKVLFTETECLVVSPDFKMPDENQILLKVPRQNNMYSFDMKTPGLTKDYACLIAKATSDESKLWHRRLGHINFKQLNKLVKGNLVRGLPSKVFRNDHTCVACQKEKPNVKGIGYRWMFDIDYLTDSINYIPVSLENQSKPHAGTSAVTNHAGTSEATNSAGTSNTNASEEEDEAGELIILPTAVQHTAEKVGTRKPSINSKKEDCLIELQNLKSQEKEASPKGITEDAMYSRFSKRVDMIQTCQNSKSSTGLSKGSLIRLLTMKKEYKATSYFSFASFLLGFIVYKMDGNKCIFVWHIDEGVRFSQPPGFVDPDHPKKVYKVVKALYGLHQAPRAWYATLSTFLEEHRYRRGTIDKTLFIKKDKKDIMLVQVYVDDIIFCSTGKSWCDEFKALMKGIFQMSSMGELVFFLGLQVKQKIDGNFYLQTSMLPDMLKSLSLQIHDRLISWQCKKQTIVATSTTEAEYVAAASCCGQILMKRSRFRVEKVHTDFNVVAIGEKAFDGPRFNFLVVNIELRATIDTHEYTITEASVRSKLKLADASGISMLPNTKIFERMGNMGYPTDGFKQNPAGTHSLPFLTITPPPIVSTAPPETPPFH
ncbi:ribonuclease H-like domain-containing protein [Tanacetum coccineum]